MTDSILRAALLCALLLTYLALWKLKRRAQLKGTGVNPEVMHQDPRPSQRYFSAMTRALTLAVIALIGLHGWGGLSTVTPFAPWFELPLAAHLIGGALLGFSGLGLCAWAQATMGRAWRVGIDAASEEGLITHGLYRWMRNPTYTGLFGVCAAIFWVFPSALFALWIQAFIILLEAQVRLEEEYLVERFGDTYLKYTKNVKRYIPNLY